MASVKLKTNLIVEGHFYKFGTVIDEEKVPLKYRKRKYILREGETDPKEIERAQQMAIMQGEMEEVNSKDILTDEVNDQTKRVGRR